MGYYIGLIILVIFAILENSVLIDIRAIVGNLAGLSTFYGQPSLVLLAVIAWSWHADINESLFWAFIGGFALDLLNPIIPLGTSVIALIVAIFAVKAVERLFYQVSIFALIGFVAMATLIHQAILLIVFLVLNASPPFIDYLQYYSVPTLAFNLLGIMPIYWILRRIQKRLPQRQNPWAVDAGSRR